MIQWLFTRNKITQLIFNFCDIRIFKYGANLPNKRLFLWQMIAKNKLKKQWKEKKGLVGSVDILQSNTNSDFQENALKNIFKMAMVLDLIPLYKRPLTLKEPGFLDPSHSRGGGGGSPKISETDWRNIKCVVLVDSYDPPESIGTKKSTNIPCMTPQWRHKWRHVKNTKIAKIMVFRYFFKQSCNFWQWCVSKYAYTCSYSK